MSPIPQMEGLDHRIHAGFGRHLAGALVFHLKSLSICVICGFNSLFQAHQKVARGLYGSRAFPAPQRSLRESSLRFQPHGYGLAG
jgi:hypothetical protein